MRLSTGKVAFPIQFDDDKKETLYLNPNDGGLAVRMMDAQKILENGLETLDKENIEINGDGSINISNLPIEQAKKVIMRYNEVVKVITDAIDYAFASNISEVVFKYCSPLAYIADKKTLFVYHFMDEISKDIQKYLEKKSNMHSENVQKYISKYSENK